MIRRVLGLLRRQPPTVSSRNRDEAWQAWEHAVAGALPTAAPGPGAPWDAAELAGARQLRGQAIAGCWGE